MTSQHCKKNRWGMRRGIQFKEPVQGRSISGYSSREHEPVFRIQEVVMTKI